MAIFWFALSNSRKYSVIHGVVIYNDFQSITLPGLNDISSFKYIKIVIISFFATGPALNIAPTPAVVMEKGEV